jgi:cytochrome c oxidase cbb3-type subunit 4
MNPDTLNLLRGLTTVLAMLAFLAIVTWAWSHRRRDEFDRAGRMPLEEDDAPPHSQNTSSSRGASDRERT